MNKSYIHYDDNNNEYCIKTVSLNHHEVYINDVFKESFDTYEQAQHFIDGEV